MTGARAKPLPDWLWEQHRNQILNLYTQMPLPELVQYMSRHVNFQATARQYKRKLNLWGACKTKRQFERLRLHPSHEQDVLSPLDEMTALSPSSRLNSSGLPQASLVNNQHILPWLNDGISAQTNSLSWSFDNDLVNTQNLSGPSSLIGSIQSVLNNSNSLRDLKAFPSNVGAPNTIQCQNSPQLPKIQCLANSELASWSRSLRNIRPLILMHLLLDISRVALIDSTKTNNTSQTWWPPYQSDICQPQSSVFDVGFNVFNSHLRERALELYQLFGKSEMDRRLTSTLTIQFLACWRLNSPFVPQRYKGRASQVEEHHATLIAGAFVSAKLALYKSPKTRLSMDTLYFTPDEPDVTPLKAFCDLSEQVMIVLSKIFDRVPQEEVPEHYWTVILHRWSETWNQQNLPHADMQQSAKWWLTNIGAFVECVEGALFREENGPEATCTFSVSKTEVFRFTVGSLAQHFYSEWQAQRFCE